MRLSPAAVARLPESWKLCTEHLRESLGGTKAQKVAARRQKHPIYGDSEPMTCYGLAGTCPNQGDLYASGPYCEEHKPKSS